MKGITGHRVLDAYANMALTPVRTVQQQGQQVPDRGGNGRAQDAATVNISEGARRMAQGPTVDPARVESLQEKVALGPAAFDTGVVAQRLVGELTG